jgi:hypothetical protein
VDPVLTDANTGKSFNRYNYAGNNPYKYIDPDGRSDSLPYAISRPDSLDGLVNVMRDIVAGGNAAISPIKAAISSIPVSESIVNKTTVTASFGEVTHSVNGTTGGQSTFVGVRMVPGIAIQNTTEGQLKIGDMSGPTAKVSVSAGIGVGVAVSGAVSIGDGTNSGGMQFSAGMAGKTGGIFGVRPPSVAVGYTVKHTSNEENVKKVEK